MPLNPPRVAVVGAGVIGVTSAYRLIERGFSVTLFDRRPGAAMETSHANGGQLSASNAEVWSSWPTILDGLRYMLRADAPLRIHPAPGWQKLSWFAAFARAIGSHDERTIALARMAVASRRGLDAMAAREGIDFDRVGRGILHICTSRRDWDRAVRVATLLAEAGVEQRPVGPDEIRSIEPALQGRYHGGFYTADDFSGDAAKFTRGLAQACARRGGDLRFALGIDGIDPGADGVLIRAGDGGFAERFDAVVIAAGVKSRGLAAMAGVRANLYPVKGHSITVALGDAGSRAAAPWTSLTDESARIVASRLGEERLRIAGTAEFAGENLTINPRRTAPLLAWCRHHFPGIALDEVEAWAGLRPMMPDQMPLVGSTARDRVFLNTGHGHLGWTLAAASADLLTASITARFADFTSAPPSSDN